jgi:ribosomal protein S27AE
MWEFKKCPRCRGDIFMDEDTDRSYEKCLQCGYEREISRVANTGKKLRPEKEKTMVR